jgi:hypothetical protein
MEHTGTVILALPAGLYSSFSICSLNSLKESRGNVPEPADELAYDVLHGHTAELFKDDG